MELGDFADLPYDSHYIKNCFYVLKFHFKRIIELNTLHICKLCRYKSIQFNLIT